MLDLEGRQEVQESTGGRQQLREPSAPGKGCCDACSLSPLYDHPLNLCTQCEMGEHPEVLGGVMRFVGISKHPLASALASLHLWAVKLQTEPYGS